MTTNDEFSEAEARDMGLSQDEANRARAEQERALGRTTDDD